MRATSSFTQTGSVVLIRLVTSNSLRRNCIVRAPGLQLVVFSCPWVKGTSTPFCGEIRAHRKGPLRAVKTSQSTRLGVRFHRTSSEEKDPWPTIAENAEEIKRRIGELNLEHRDLDRAIEALELNPLHDELQLKRLKKRKLMLKDQIFMLQRQLVPDIPPEPRFAPASRRTRPRLNHRPASGVIHDDRAPRGRW